MQNLSFQLEELFSLALSCFLGQEVRADIAQSSDLQFGHYQCNSALRLSKELKRSPREIAQGIIAQLPISSLFEKVEIAGPGFINITLSAHFLSEQIEQLLNSPTFGVALPQREKMIVDFSAPNVAKELHVGHLRSTIIGDCLARIFEFLGHDVLRLNHIGDWGTQFGMLIAYIEEHSKEITDLPTLMHWYKAAKVEFDANPEFKKRAQQKVVELQSGQVNARQAWEKICAVSRLAFDEIYALLDVRLVERGESFYNPYLPSLIDDLEKRGAITISGGAKCIFLDGFINQDGHPLPMIVQKSDGGYNYDTTDLAALHHRIFVEKAKRIIYLSDLGQTLHFQMLFKAAEKVGYLNPEEVRIDHVGFGLVLGPDGKKFKTRSGTTEKLIDLLLEAVVQAKTILRERLPDLSEEELEVRARILGIGAVKYADLSCNRLKDYSFSYERMLKFDGNTAAFLLYAYVRIQGIFRKVGKDISLLLTKPKLSLQHPTEILLALHLRQFGEVFDVLTRDLFPNRLTDYLYQLAEKFHAFFRDCRVEGSDCEESRLLLCAATGRVLKKGVELLGLKTLDRM